MQNEIRLSDRNVNFREWRRQHLKLTRAGFFTWVAPILAWGIHDWQSFLAGMISIVIGIHLSDNGWRKMSGAVFLIAFLVLVIDDYFEHGDGSAVGGTVGVYWIICGLYTWYADGQRRNREQKRAREEWE